MTLPRTPDEGNGAADVMDTDAEIERMRCGGGPAADPALQMVGALRDDIDRRCAALLGQIGNDDASSLLGAALTLELGGAKPLTSRMPVRTRRNTRRRRLAVIPMAGALVLGSTGVAAALSGSPTSAFYPLHQVIFGPTASSDGQIARDVAAAGKLLDQAAKLSMEQRSGLLTQARVILYAAHGLLPSASSANARTGLSREIAAAQLRAEQLTQPLEHPSEITPKATTPTVAPSAPSHPSDDPAPSLGSDERSAPDGAVAHAENQTPSTQPGSEPTESAAPAAPEAPAASEALHEGISDSNAPDQ